MELPDVGKQCSHNACGRLDFLPYKCTVCNLPFCDEHVRQHGCVYEEEENEVKDLSLRKRREDNTQQCEEEGCKDVRSHMLIQCEVCSGHYCVTHRHINCPKVASTVVPPDPALAAAEMFKYAKETVDKEVNYNIERARKKSKNADMANKVQLMRLKSKAVGLPSIATQDRAYFLIKTGKEKNEKQEYPIFISSDWTIGRAIDSIAATCKLKNQNNLPNAPKLMLFRASDNHILTENLADKISELFSKNVICNGATLNIDYM